MNLKKKFLRYILYFYILLCLIFASLNYGYAPNASEITRKLIENLWHFYENGFKTIMIITAALITISIINKDSKYDHRKRNIVGLSITAVVLHVFLPYVLNVYEIYFFSMPAPFTNTGFQLLNTSSEFYQSRIPVWGLGTLTIITGLFIIYSLFIYIGTYIKGRKLQCSTLCLFNGFIGEIFSPIFTTSRKPYKFLKLFRIIFFILGVFFTCYWLYRIFNSGIFSLLEEIETFKYLVGELLFAMFLWVAFTGRGYCYYCPLGTTLAQVAKLGNMRIDTTENHCINCGKCNNVCPMNINIQSLAAKGLPVKNSLCVGCGHCVDACPTSTLKYRTKYIT